MIRNESLEDISDGHRYGLNDMVRADSGGCKGCSACCETMTDTIILSPLDVFRISLCTGKSFEELLSGFVELNMHDGVILPNIASGGCGCIFLSEEKRCTIHDSRPDFCRLFPLGRLYENGSYSYILQVGQCRAKCSKIKVKKWIDTQDYDRHREYVLLWHDIIRKTGELVAGSENENCRKQLSMRLLNDFYITGFAGEPDFYDSFRNRAEAFIEFSDRLREEEDGI